MHAASLSLATFALFLPACFALNMALGPNNVLSLSNGARVGIRTSVLASSGRLLAFAVMIALSGVGLGGLLLASELWFTALKLGGACYLVWIGVRLLRAHPASLPAAMAERNMQEAPGRTGTLARLAKQEFLVAAGNPKAILIFTAFFPQFVDRAHYAASFTLLGTTFLLLELVAIGIYAALGARLGAVAHRTQAFRWLNRVSGSMMIGFGVTLALLRRPAT